MLSLKHISSHKMTSPVTYDRRSFKLNDRPFIILSGSVHYIRQHPSKWAKIFETFHAAGLNTIETYVFWSAHDRFPSPPDFTGRNDLFGFIAAAGEAGLHVILRLGPYVCAEVSYGGFPFRLRDTPGIKFRTFNKVFMEQVETWVRLIARELRDNKLLALAGGPVILVQLENEYSMVSDAYGEEGGKYLQWCADLQNDLDLGVPAIMCYGAAEGVVETINAFYGHEHIKQHRERHRNQPPVWTEAWTGWYDTWGAPHHTRSAEDLSYAVARFFAAGGAGINYYMWAGGTNYGREGMYLQATSYDYDAPVDEFGRLTSKARHLARLHAVLQKVFVDRFLKLDHDSEMKDGACHWGDVSFICNDRDQEMVDLDLPHGRYEGVVRGRSVHIVDADGKCLYDTATIHEDDIVSRVVQKLECSSTEWKYCEEVIPTFSGVSDQRIVKISDTPTEQLAMTKNESDYAFYATRIKGSRRTTMTFKAADIAYVYIDGRLVGGTEMPPWEDRWSNKWNHYARDRGLEHKIEVLLDGTHDLCIMTASLGLVKGDWQLREGQGMEGEAKGLLSDIGGVERTEKWCCVGGLAGENLTSIPFDEVVKNGAPGWYSCTVRMKETSESCLLDLSKLGKGLFWVNDVLLGRFWDVEGTRGMNGFLDGSPIRQERVGEPTQKMYHVPPWVIGDRKEGGYEMRVVLFVERGPPQGPLASEVLHSC